MALLLFGGGPPGGAHAAGELAHQSGGGLDGRRRRAVVGIEAGLDGGHDGGAHHHGIGKYRTAWTAQEHGSAYPLLAGLKAAFDPNGIMNPGTIFPLEK